MLEVRFSVVIGSPRLTRDAGVPRGVPGLRMGCMMFGGDGIGGDIMELAASILFWQ